MKKRSSHKKEEILTDEKNGSHEKEEILTDGYE